MHPNPVFRGAADQRNIGFVRDRGFGMLSINADPAPLLSHIPFVLAEDGSTAELHLMRSNPILRALGTPLPAVIAVQGPDSYISPDWYGIQDQVPTWNYVAVHLRGVLEPRPADELHAMLDRLSAHFETRLQGKSPWTSDKMSDGVMERMMRQIAPCLFRVETIAATWKLNQNKDDAVRMAAAQSVAEDGIGSALAELSALMQDPPNRE